MNRLRALAASLLMLTITPLVPLGGAATAQAAVTSRAVEFTCPSGDLCVFQNTGFAGTHCEFNSATSFSLRGCGLTVPWGSFNNEWPKAVVFTDVASGQAFCFLSGTRITPDAAVRAAGFVDLSTVNSCPG